MCWVRARIYVNAQLEQLLKMKPNPEAGIDESYIRGRRDEILHLKANYFLTREEEAEVWKTRKEMGF